MKKLLTTLVLTLMLSSAIWAGNINGTVVDPPPPPPATSPLLSVVLNILSLF